MCYFYWLFGNFLHCIPITLNSHYSQVHPPPLCLPTPPYPLPEAFNYAELCFSIFATIFKDSLQWLPVWTVSSPPHSPLVGVLPQKPSMSLILNVELAVIDTTAKEASLLRTASGNTDYGIQYDFNWEAAWITDIDMVSCGSPDHEHQHSLWRLQIIDTNKASGGSREHRHPHGLRWQHYSFWLYLCSSFYTINFQVCPLECNSEFLEVLFMFLFF